MDASPGPSRGRKAREMVARYKCSMCEYTSKRYYNVTRHEFRIHSASSKQRECCNTFFTTKGDYYLHCEECHPYSRTANLTSRHKYKIFTRQEIIESQESVDSSNERMSEQKITTRAPYMLRSTTNVNQPNTSKYKEETDDSESSDEDSTIDERRTSDEDESLDFGRDSSFLKTEDKKNFTDDLFTKELNDSKEKSEKNLSTLESLPRDNSITSENMEIKNFKISIEDESEKKFVSPSIATPSGSCELPIKKRILQIYKPENHRIESIVDRLNRRINDEREDSLKDEKKIHTTEKIKKTTEPEDSSDIENNLPVASCDEEEKTAKSENSGKIEVRVLDDHAYLTYVDPQISLPDITSGHRQYLDGLLRDQSIRDRFTDKST